MEWVSKTRNAWVRSTLSLLRTLLLSTMNLQVKSLGTLEGSLGVSLHFGG